MWCVCCQTDWWWCHRLGFLCQKIGNQSVYLVGKFCKYSIFLKCSFELLSFLCRLFVKCLSGAILRVSCYLMCCMNFEFVLLVLISSDIIILICIIIKLLCNNHPHLEEKYSHQSDYLALLWASTYKYNTLSQGCPPRYVNTSGIVFKMQHHQLTVSKI